MNKKSDYIPVNELDTDTRKALRKDSVVLLEEVDSNTTRLFLSSGYQLKANGSMRDWLKKLDD